MISIVISSIVWRSISTVVELLHPQAIWLFVCGTFLQVVHGKNRPAGRVMVARYGKWSGHILNLEQILAQCSFDRSVIIWEETVRAEDENSTRN
uniref:Uncharacterized protein n=1 Tax=Parascaris univalens TaxID=6257 RepID=A0A915BNK0_PARUN